MTQLAFFVACLHVFICPFTKVEESFNIQAAHDILYHRLNISQYDHKEFPGVVPRTFIGSLVASAMAAPAAVAFQVIGINKFWLQYVVRLTLAMAIMGAWVRLRKTLKDLFGPTFIWWFTIVTVTQYHFMFYLSRPLPNMMALPLVLIAFEAWISGKYRKFLFCSGASIVIFRSELAILFGLFLIMDIYFKNIKIVNVLKLMIPIGLGLILLTVVVDSIFWGRLVWPEAEVFWFNTVLNKSSDWGTSPFLWYFYSALPRGLGPCFVLVPVGAYLDKRCLPFVAPATTYVLLYSLLPHKELRFIIYVFPLFNIAAASACTFFYLRRHKRIVYQLVFWGVILLIIGNVCLTLSLTAVAMKNYPGGEAIIKFHRLLKDEPYVHVHVSNLAAQTGVTRFTEINNKWKYSKEEYLTPDELQQYTHLIVEAKSKYSANLKPFAQTHVILDSVTMFAQVGFSPRLFPPIRLKTRPALFILERKNFRDGPQGIGIPMEDTPEESTSAQASVEEEVVVERPTGPTLLIHDDILIPQLNIGEDITEREDPAQTDDTNAQTDTALVLTEEGTQETKPALDTLKSDWKQDRKQKAIEKITSVTRKEVVASAKDKLREILKKHRLQQQQIAKEASEEKGEEHVEQHTAPGTHVDDHIMKILANESIEGIVEEVVVRLIDKKLFDDKTKPEDLTSEDRSVIHHVVEQVLLDKVANAKDPNTEDR